MGHRYHHHPALDDLLNLLIKANHELTVVQSRLEREFRQIYPDNRIQEHLLSLKVQCRGLLAAKQNLIDKARTTLVGTLLQRMQASSGLPVTNNSEDPAYTNFNQIIDEWTIQVRSKTGDEKDGSDSGDEKFTMIQTSITGTCLYSSSILKRLRNYWTNTTDMAQHHPSTSIRRLIASSQAPSPHTNKLIFKSCT